MNKINKYLEKLETFCVPNTPTYMVSEALIEYYYLHSCLEWEVTPTMAKRMLKQGNKKGYFRELFEEPYLSICLDYDVILEALNVLSELKILKKAYYVTHSFGSAENAQERLYYPLEMHPTIDAFLKAEPESAMIKHPEKDELIKCKELYQQFTVKMDSKQGFFNG